MKPRVWVGFWAMALLAGCAAHSPLPAAPAIADLPATLAPAAAGDSGDRQVYPDGNSYRVMDVAELPLVAVTVDSTSNGVAASIIDGNLATSWSNGGYHNSTAWAAVKLSGSASLASIAIKTGPLPAGTSYDVQVSANGTSWTTGLAQQTNTTWNLETKTLPANTSGSYVRIFWHNSASSPQPHFAIFELAVNGPAGSSTPPPSPAPSPLPTSTPVGSPTPTPAGSPGPVLKLTPVAVTATSTYNDLVPQRAIDGDTNTQWESGTYQSQSEALTLHFDRRYAFDHLAIKTGYLPGLVMYWAEASDDGTTWTTVAGSFRNTTWTSETKLLAGEGSYLRIRFANTFGTPLLSRFAIFDLQVYGKTNPSATTQSLTLKAATQSVPYGPAVSFGGPIGNVIDTATNAYNDTLQGLKFPAMVFTDLGRYGYDSTRVTPLNAPYVLGDLGAPGSATFIDTTSGLADNSGSWVFTMQNGNGDVSASEALANQNVTTFDPTRVGVLDLGPTVRRWRLGGGYSVPQFDSAQYDPPVVLVYKRPDGVWDFTLALGNVFPPGDVPVAVDTSGLVYAFFLTENSSGGHDAQLTLTAEN